MAGSTDGQIGGQTVKKGQANRQTDGLMNVKLFARTRLKIMVKIDNLTFELFLSGLITKQEQCTYCVL